MDSKSVNPRPTFGRRKLARRYVLQALYGWELSNNDLKDIEADTLLEHAKDKFDRDYFIILLHEIPKQVAEIDLIMSPYLSRKLEDLGVIELTVLRIAVYELKEKLDIPYKVVINEALELAKTYGSQDSHKFVNGVLDKVAKQIRINETKY